MSDSFFDFLDDYLLVLCALHLRNGLFEDNSSEDRLENLEHAAPVQAQVFLTPEINIYLYVLELSNTCDFFFVKFLEFFP